MHITALGLLLLFTSTACLAGNDIWETLFREKLKEANAGSSSAQYDIAAMYQNGRGVAANRTRAIEWYRKAAAQNDQKAISRLNLIQSNEARFNKTLARARVNDLESLYDLGNMFGEGIGVDADMAKARYWYEKAASQGFEKAQYKLGLSYYKDSSSGKDLSHAFELFRKAAEKGHPAAQFYLGKMYASGQGVKRDYETALEWFSKAVDSGFNEARREMTDIAELLENRPGDRNPETLQTAKPASKPATTDMPGKTTGYSFEDLMLASWNRESQPVAYLPSAINNCRVQDDSIICFSDDQSRNTVAGTIKYKTKAIVGSVSEAGFFEVVYRNLVIDSDQASVRKKGGTEEVVGSTTTGPVKLNYEVKTGWGKEHSLQCQFRDNSTLSCVKNKTHAFLLETPRTLAAGN
jgi:TPR repeat protein